MKMLYASHRQRILVVIAAILLIASHCVGRAAWQRRPTAATAYQPLSASDIYVHLQPGEFAGTLLLGGLRGLVTDLLWMRSLSAKESGRFYESIALSQLITQVQPHFPIVWEYLAHDQAFNITRELSDPQEQWDWYLAGIDTCVRGFLRNPDSDRLLRHLAFTLHHKGEHFAQRCLEHDWSGALNPILDLFAPDSWRIVRGRVSAVTAPGQATVTMDDSVALPLAVLVGDDEGWAAGLLDGDGLRLDPGADPQVLRPGARVVPALTHLELARRIYHASILLLERRGETGGAFAYVRRFLPILRTRDGFRLRNQGRHLDALHIFIDCLDEWQAVTAWMEDPAHGLDDFERQHARHTAAHHVPALRRQAAHLARVLAEDPDQGEALATAIEDGHLDQAQELLARGRWRRQAATMRDGLWFDE